MSIQPGPGYTFTSSSLGTNLNIQQPWSEWDSSSLPAEVFQQFQLRSIKVGIENKLQLAKGTCSFTQSNMPRVRLGGHYDQRQTWISKVAIYGSGVSPTPGGSPSTDIWMEGGGYYNVSPGTYYVTISKFDISQSNDDTDSLLLNAEAPWVSIFPSGSGIESVIFSETGPSEYVNKTNMHKMTGYDADSTGLSGDWGNCHTTWFNPVKWGYSVKLIGIVTATTGAGGDIEFSIDQHIVGPIDLHIPCLFNGTTLCNQDELNETNDPYNLNKNGSPAWSDIVNSNQLDDMNTLSPANEDWFQEFVGPADWTAYNYSYLIPASCAAQDDGQTCEHPFQFHPFTVSDGGSGFLFRANVCSGMVNNLVPFDEPSSGTQLPATIDFLTYADTSIYLRLGTDDYTTDDPIFPVTDTANSHYPTMVQYPTAGVQPVDTDEYCYILMGVARNIGDPDTFTIDQTISGSVWAERLKIGTETARYYWAAV